MDLQFSKKYKEQVEYVSYTNTTTTVSHENTIMKTLYHQPSHRSPMIS